MSSTAFCFYNIAPFSPGEETLLAEEMKEYCALTGNDTVLYSLTLHPEGYPAIRKAEFLCHSYRRLRQALEGSSVRLGVLLQSVLGHRARVDKNEEPWSRSINIDGEAVRYCPYDPDFQQYILTVVTMLMREKPIFLLSDDDIRSFSPKVECFCPRHTEEFNRRAGTAFTPEQYRQAVRNCQVGDELYQRFDELRRDTVNGVVRLIRQAMDAVDPGVPAGTCMPGWEFRFNGEAAKVIAGKHPAVMRICNAMYMESSAKALAGNIIRTQALRQFHADIPVLLDESDTCPHNLYSKSSCSLHAKLVSGIMSGLNGAKVWLVNAHKNGYPVSRNYTAVLARNRGLYQQLAREVRLSSPAGLIVPGHTLFPGWHPAVSTSEFFVEPSSWGESMCGVFGVPFQCSFDFAQEGRIYTLAGRRTVERFTDLELRQMLTRKLLVDGPAAVALCERGFASLLGVQAEARDFRFNREFNARTRRPYPINKTPDAPLLTLLDDRAEVLTELGYSAFKGSPENEIVAPGTVLCQNDVGGLVCVTAFHMNTALNLWNEPRKSWFLEILDRLNGAPIPYCVLNEQNFAVLQREAADGTTLLAVFNLNFDVAPELSLRCPKTPAAVERLAGDGQWLVQPFTRTGAEYRLAVPLACYDCAVFRFS